MKKLQMKAGEAVMALAREAGNHSMALAFLAPTVAGASVMQLAHFLGLKDNGKTIESALKLCDRDHYHRSPTLQHWCLPLIEALGRMPGSKKPKSAAFKKLNLSQPRFI